MKIKTTRKFKSKRNKEDLKKIKHSLLKVSSFIRNWMKKKKLFRNHPLVGVGAAVDMVRQEGENKRMGVMVLN